MHVSVYKNSPHYNPDAVKRMKCYVNGIDVTTKTFEASEEEGFVKCYKVDEASQKWIVDPETGEPQTEELRGKVELVIDRGGSGEEEDD